MDQTWFRIDGRVTHVVTDGGVITVFHVRHGRVTIVFAASALPLPVEYINQVVQLGARVCVTGEIRGAIHDVRFICNPVTVNARLRLVCRLFAMGFAQGVRARLPMAEFVDRDLMRVWIEKQRERVSFFRKVVR